VKTLLDALERDMSAHVTAGPSTDGELEALTRVLGSPLPEALACFLRRLGGGLYYNGDEIFGPRRVVIHDIELVPDILSVRSQLAKKQIPVPDGVIPFHRKGGTLHLVDVRQGRDPVFAMPAAETFPDIRTFLYATFGETRMP
jgi:hypothetical protein